MIDHILGRPSIRFRKLQVFAVVSFWSLYLLRGDKHGPPILRRISERFSKHLTSWQTVVITLLYLYICRNFAKIMGFESPEPLANLYSRAYFRATWITTALDAGFWTAMKIRRKWLRDIASIVFTLHYLIMAEQADEKVRKVRGLLTVDHLRVSWNKSTTPYLRAFTAMLRPRLTKYPPRALRLPRPAGSSYTEPIEAWLYFDGPLSALKNHTKLILDMPGGGFVAMTPRHHEDKLLLWAGKTGLPVLSLDYKKAPEHPYPFSLNECFDAYYTLVATRGRCIGFSGDVAPRIILTGDSAGGNFAVGTTLMILQGSSSENVGWQTSASNLPAPEGLILIYPALDMNIGSWMSDEQMALIQDRGMRKTNRPVMRKKSEDYYKLAKTPHPSDNEASDDDMATSKGGGLSKDTKAGKDDSDAPDTVKDAKRALTASKPKVLRTRLAMSSMISYFNDRILTPEMMRAMIILYIGPHHRPDFATDYLLSPILAPEQLLAKFPKTYFLTGERDPLVDDTIIFAGRLRQAKAHTFVQRQELGLISEHEDFDEKDYVEISLLPGISHGFLQFVSIFPEAWKHLARCARWMEDIFESNEPMALSKPASHEQSQSPETTRDLPESERHHRRAATESSGEEDNPLMMTSSRPSESRPRASTRGRGRRVKHTDGREKSMLSLGSETDLLARRMKGLTGSLMGGQNDGTATP